jgi:hypothetical protein
LCIQKISEGYYSSLYEAAIPDVSSQSCAGIRNVYTLPHVSVWRVS